MAQNSYQFVLWVIFSLPLPERLPLPLCYSADVVIVVNELVGDVVQHSNILLSFQFLLSLPRCLFFLFCYYSNFISKGKVKEMRSVIRFILVQTHLRRVTKNKFEISAILTFYLITSCQFCSISSVGLVHTSYSLALSSSDLFRRHTINVIIQNAFGNVFDCEIFVIYEITKPNITCKLCYLRNQFRYPVQL